MSETRKTSAAFARSAMVAAVLALAACDSAEERAERHYDRGMALLSEGESARATLEFRNAVRLEDGHAGARLEIAKLYEADGEYQAALSNYRYVTELDPANVEARVRGSQLLTLGGGLADARRFAEEAVALAPDNADAHTSLAAVLMHLGEFDAAIAAAEAGLAVSPGFVPAELVLVSARMRAGDPDAALARLDELRDRDPRELSVALTKLRLLQQEGRLDALSPYLEELIRDFPEQREFKQALAGLRATQGDEAGALALLREIAEADPDNVDAVLNLARAEAAVNGFDAARAILRAQIERAGASEAAFPFVSALADLEYADGRPTEAEALLRAETDEAAPAARRNDAKVRLAQIVAAQNRAEEAERLAAEVIEADPSNTDALSLRARLRLAADDPEGALSDLRMAMAADPQNADLMLLTAQAHERNGSTELAGERLAAAMRASNYQPRIAIAYARFLNGAGRAEGAETVLAETAQRNPSDQTVLVALAEQRIRLSDWGGVERAAAQLSGLEGGAESATRIRAAALAGQGRLNESIATLQALSDGENNGGAMTQLVAAYVRNGEMDRASNFIDETLAADPENRAALLLRAEVALLQGDQDAAESALGRMIETSPESYQGHLAMARLALLRNRPEQAEDALRVGIEAAEDPTSIRLLLAQVLEQRGDVNGAIEQYEAIYAVNSGSVVVANNLASLLSEHRADDPDSIARAAAIARRLRSSDVPEFQDTYGWTLFLQGDYEGALRALAPAAEARPGNPYIRYHTGMTFARLGRVEDARDHLTAAVSLDSSFSRIEAAQAALAALPAAAEAGQ
jgi:tetratricopeptide (TPR) repeat protein